MLWALLASALQHQQQEQLAAGGRRMGFQSQGDEDDLGGEGASGQQLQKQRAQEVAALCKAALGLTQYFALDSASLPK